MPPPFFLFCFFNFYFGCEYSQLNLKSSFKIQNRKNARSKLPGQGKGTPDAAARRGGDEGAHAALPRPHPEPRVRLHWVSLSRNTGLLPQRMWRCWREQAGTPAGSQSRPASMAGSGTGGRRRCPGTLGCLQAVVRLHSFVFLSPAGCGGEEQHLPSLPGPHCGVNS